MPLLFAYLCDLFDTLEHPHVRDVPYLPDYFERYVRENTIDWLKHHARRLNANDTDDQAVMLMLYPEKQVDRDYGISPTDLELIIARVLRLSRDQYNDLRKWQHEGSKGDLAVHVKRVMDNMKRDKQQVRAQTNSVTVDEIDQSLLRIAAFSPASSPAVQSLAVNWKNKDQVDLLSNLYSRLSGREAKWLTRLILKDLSPVKVPDNLGLAANLSQLPNFLSVSIQFAPPTSSAIRRDGSGVVLGEGTALPVNRHMPKTHAALLPPAASGSSSNRPQTNPAKLVTASLTSSTPVVAQSHFPPTPPKSSPILIPPELKTARPSSLPKYVALCPNSSGTSSLSRHSRRPVCSPRESQASHPPSSSRTPLGPISSHLPRRQNSQPKSKGNSKTGTPLVTAGTGICRMSSKICPLTNCIFLLAPCLTKTPYILEDLLSWHGSHYITSISALSHPSLPRRCSKTGNRYRKIVLVESHRTKQTIEFLNRVGKLGLKRNGKKEWVEVYDWRILECIGKMDQGKALDYNPWKRCWVCAI